MDEDSEKMDDSDLAIAIGEDAFRAGFEAGVLAEGGGAKEYWSDSMLAELEKAWSDYDPPEDLKGRNF